MRATFLLVGVVRQLKSCNGCLSFHWHSFSGVGVAVGESGVTSSTKNGVLSNGLFVSSSDCCERPIDWSIRRDGCIHIQAF